MNELLTWARAFVLSFGGPGLFVVAFLDSSFLSLPEINDILLVLMVTQHKERVVFYAAMATLGSVAGCLVLYGLAYKGGEAFLRKRMKAGRVERGMQAFRKYGVLALLVPSILPPPAPFKIFVLLAGVARVPPRKFVMVIGLGRGLRYFCEGLLAVWYGDMAMAYVKEHGDHVALAAAILVAVGGLAVVLWRRRAVEPS
jgi:membrane protein YqaA with SNARE-associated domain